MTDLDIENVKNSLIDTRNNSNLPFGVLLYMVNDIARQLNEAYNRSIKLEMQKVNQTSFQEPSIEDSNKNNSDEV